MKLEGPVVATLPVADGLVLETGSGPRGDRHAHPFVSPTSTVDRLRFLPWRCDGPALIRALTSTLSALGFAAQTSFTLERYRGVTLEGLAAV
jgi:hypothetical protein